MTQLYKYLFLLIFTVCTLVVGAQEEVPSTDTSTVIVNPIFPKANNLFNTRLAFTVPNPISNKAFNKSFIGIYQVNASMNMALYKNIFIGVAFSDALLQISKNIVPNTTYAKQPFMNVYNAAVKLGSDFRLGDKNRIILSTAILVGQSYVKYSSFVSKVPTENIQITNFKSLYGEAEVNMIFLIEPNWGIGPSISYSLIKRNFNPFELALDEYTSYSSNSSGATQYFSFGFVCHYSFFKK